jgi:hypothetical protein
MITAEKIKQVRKQLRSGVPQGEIKNDLVKEGYTDKDIDQVFVPQQSDMKSWYLFFAILFLLTGLYNLMVNTGFLFLLFSAGMFYVYFRELKK